MSSSNNSTGPVGTNIPYCPATNPQEWIRGKIPLTGVCMVIVALQMFTLVTFRRWRPREPFLTLHVSLAWGSLAFGAIGVGIAIISMFPWTVSVATASRAFNWLIGGAHNASSLTLLFISVDRWLSVEFPVKYRLKISQEKINRAVCILFGLSFLHWFPGMVVYWDAVQVYCNRPATLFYPSFWFLLYSMIGPFMLSLTGLVQLRIITIAVATKLRLVRARRRIGNSRNRPSVSVPLSELMGIIRGPLTASMVMVIVQLVANIPYLTTVHFASRYHWSSQATAFWSVVWLAVQHVFSPGVYLTLFPLFRATAKRMCCGVGIKRRRGVALFSIVHAAKFQGYNFYRGNGPVSSGLVTEGATLMLNGKPLRILSGAIHYFRVVPEYWEDRLTKLKAAGLNTVETYVPWNLHEPRPGVFDFDGILDIRNFIEIAKRLDLLVIFRPGPYICAEWEFGGLPSWLLTIPGMKVRSNNKPYLDATNRYLENLIPRIADLQFQKNGPIILVQVENEYGAYGNDTVFMDASKQQLVTHGIVETFVTSDGPKDLTPGKATNVWMTVNEKNDMGTHLDTLKSLQPNKPLMVMEYWSGWFDHWNENHHTISLKKFSLELRAILSRNASVNFYVFFGGTNFGFLNGANFALENPSMPYEPTITSYDYDAILSEGGKLTAKWHRTREILQEFGLLADDLPQPPADVPAFAYGQVIFQQWMSLDSLTLGVKGQQMDDPIQMEYIEVFPAVPVTPLVYNTSAGFQSYGYVLYSVDIPNVNSTIVLGELHDRAQVLLDGVQIKLFDYPESENEEHKFDVKYRPGPNENDKRHLQILVENMGRANYARKDALADLDTQWKGMHGQVKINSQPLNNWTAYPLEFGKGAASFLTPAFQPYWKQSLVRQRFPRLMQSTLNVSDDQPRDTYLDLTGWGRGVVFINGFNIGRYWPDAGPQQTLYVPGPVLKKGANSVVVFELEKSLGFATFMDVPQLDKLTSGNSPSPSASPVTTQAPPASTPSSTATGLICSFAAFLLCLAIAF
ncbi:Beta-galactosidase-1-like protein 2 [Hypsibius exemplaris]|uniref:Beta-galactosidase-1-like protein 2 n=1 Tax=Hypsibius exemplaris TaxID=2072580 RepID=A0A1W0WKM2_HYPEX|nr:Beta-galactosidase-1-like protein 2 [Hypsibius exemplaris]